MERKELLEKYRNYWTKIPRERNGCRILFSIAHGLIERTPVNKWSLAYSLYFENTLGVFERALPLIPESSLDIPKELYDLVRPAIRHLLPVQTPEIDLVSKVEGTFGVIQGIKEGVANVSMHVKAGEKDSSKPISEGIQVPLDRILETYRVPGAGVCWVEYQFKDNRPSMGNFEPASTI